MAINKEKLLKDVVKLVNEACSADEKKVKRTVDSLDNHLQLRNSINNILKESKNPGLNTVCNQYLNAIDNGSPEELLYESFINEASNYSYLTPVNAELNDLNGRIKNYKQEIDLRKILKTMENTYSYYIVPLIQDEVVAYMEDKNPTTRVMLRQALSAFQGDPYVKEMNNILDLDNSIPNNVYLGESYEKANNVTTTEVVCSPVQYLKENESAFNVKGKYYIRKGNTVVKLNASQIQALPESFRTLCEAVNSPYVTFDMNSQSAEILDNSHNDYVTVLNDGTVRHKGVNLSESDWNATKQISFMMNEGREGFFNLVDIIRKNISENIAVLDFVKHMELNESDDRSLDVFKIKNNIFITTVNESLGRTTFYRNVNPIQAKNIINSHMGLNVDRLFEDVLPNQEKIENEIDETSKQYENYLNELTEKKQTLCSLKEDDTADASTIDEAIKLVDEEFEKVKKDYEDYKESVKEYEPGSEEDDDYKSEENITDRFSNDENEDSEEDNEKSDEDSDILTAADEDGDNLESRVTEDPESKPVSEVEGQDLPELDTTTMEDDRFTIVKVSYNKNVKTGEILNRGEVHVLIPSVDVNGNLVDEMKKVTFYISNDGVPVINNDYMPYELYNGILNAVKNCPETATVDTTKVDEIPAGEAEIDSAENPGEFVLGTEEPDYVKDVLIDPDTFGKSDDDKEFEEETKPSLSTAQKFEDREKPWDTTPRKLNDCDTAGIINPNESINPDNYPINIMISQDDLNTLGLSEQVLDKALKDRAVPYEKVDGGIKVCVNSKAAAFNLKKFIMSWTKMGENEFFDKFPELLITESIGIKGISFLNEEMLRDADDDGSVELDLPYNDDLYDTLEEEGFDIEDADPDFMTVTTEDLNDSIDLYNILNTYVTDNNIDLNSEDWTSVETFLSEFAEEKAKKESETIAAEDHVEESSENFNTFEIELPYSQELVERLADTMENDGDGHLTYYYDNQDGSDTAEESEPKSVFVTLNDPLGADALYDIVTDLDLTDDEAVSHFVDRYLEFTNGADGDAVVGDAEPTTDLIQFLNEGLKVKITNTDTHETVEFDTDDMKKEKDSDPTTFGKENYLNNIPEEETEEQKEKDEEFEDQKKAEEDEKKSEEDNGEEGDHVEESTEEPEPKKPVFKFRPKKLHESVQPKSSKSQFKFKFDTNTVKALTEHEMVRCGLFMNGIQLTPVDCYVNYGEFNSANINEEVRLIIEGEKTTAPKQNIQLLESVTVDEDKFVDGVEVAADGKAIRNIKFDAQAYSLALDDSDMVDVIYNANTPEVQVTQLPKSSIKSLAV